MDVQIACPCPPKADGEPRHDQDTVTLHEPIAPRTRRALLYDIGLLEAGSTAGDQLAMLSEGYLLRCIDAWTLTDDHGKPLPPSVENITEILVNHPRGDVVMKAADELYSEAVLLPLLLAASSSSSAGPTTPTPPVTSRTSPATNGTTSRKKRSTRSSITSIPMAVTGPMQASSGGGSSS